MQHVRGLAIMALGAFCFSGVAYAGDYSARLTPQLRRFVQRRMPVYFDIPESEKSQIRVAVANTGARAGNETLVYIIGPGECGSGGCRLLVLESKGKTYGVLGEATVVKQPISLLSSWSKGRPDIAVTVRGYGGAENTAARLCFDGRNYPSNPTVTPAIPMRDKALGQVLISEDDQGEPLYP